MDPYAWTDAEKAPYMGIVAAYRLAHGAKDFAFSDKLRAQLDDAGIEVVEGGAVFNPFRESKSHRLARIDARTKD